MQFQRTFDEKEMRSSLSCQSACSPGPSRRALRQDQGAYESVVVSIRIGRRGEMAEPTEAVNNEFGTLQRRRVKQGCLCARSAELNDLAECDAARTSLWWAEPLSP